MVKFTYHDLLHGSQRAEACMPRNEMFRVITKLWKEEKRVTRAMLYARATDLGAFPVSGTHFVGRIVVVHDIPHPEEVAADLRVMHANGEWAVDVPFDELVVSCVKERSKCEVNE